MAGPEAIFFISLIPITDSGKSEYHTNILLIARVRDRSNPSVVHQFGKPFGLSKMVAPGADSLDFEVFPDEWE